MCEIILSICYLAVSILILFMAINADSIVGKLILGAIAAAGLIVTAGLMFAGIMSFADYNEYKQLSSKSKVIVVDTGSETLELNAQEFKDTLFIELN